MSYGYRVDEVALPDLPPIKSETTLRIDASKQERPVVAVSLGPHVLDAARPRPDYKDPAGQASAFLKRIAVEVPARTKRTKYRFRRFVARWLKKNLVPISPEKDLTVESWLELTNYSEARRRELANKSKDNLLQCDDPRVAACKTFVKDEDYEKFKYPRLINSRSDVFKTMYGPWVKAAEEVVYQYPAFVKGLSEEDKVQRILELVYGATNEYYATDYTSFESHFTRELMFLTEFQLYDHLFKFCPNFAELRRMNLNVIGAPNIMRASHILAKCHARMSGEMSTSLGNGFTNLMTMLFVCEENHMTEVSGVVEGDDGLFKLKGKRLTTEMFGEVGFMIKIEYHTVLTEAGFCQMYFDPIAKQPVADPIKFLLKMGWGSRQYVHSSDQTLRALLRCKALSALSQFPACPIISVYAARLVELTADIRPYKMIKLVKKMKGASYQRDGLLRAITKPKCAQAPVQATRMLVEHKFGVTLAQQRHIELTVGHLTGLTPFRLPAFCDSFFDKDCATYYRDYVVTQPHPIGVSPVQMAGDPSYLARLCRHVESYTGRAVEGL